MNDHTIEPEAGSILIGKGEYIGDDLAKCSYCGDDISGDEDGWYHIDRELANELREK